MWIPISRLRLAVAALLLVSAVTVADEEVSEIQEFETDRVPLHTVVPGYPTAAIEQRIEGDVQVCFNVTRGGKPYRIAVRRSDNRVFEKPARDAVRASLYEPVPRGRKLSPAKTCRTFRFRLEPAESPRDAVAIESVD